MSCESSHLRLELLTPDTRRLKFELFLAWRTKANSWSWRIFYLLSNKLQYFQYHSWPVVFTKRLVLVCHRVVLWTRIRSSCLLFISFCSKLHTVVIPHWSSRVRIIIHFSIRLTTHLSFSLAMFSVKALQQSRFLHMSDIQSLFHFSMRNSRFLLFTRLSKCHLLLPC